MDWHELVLPPLSFINDSEVLTLVPVNYTNGEYQGTKTVTPQQALELLLENKGAEYTFERGTVNMNEAWINAVIKMASKL